MKDMTRSESASYSLRRALFVLRECQVYILGHGVKDKTGYYVVFEGMPQTETAWHYQLKHDLATAIEVVENHLAEDGEEVVDAGNRPGPTT